MLSGPRVPQSINGIDAQPKGREQRPSESLWEEYHSFQNKLPLGVGGSHTGISQSLKSVGDPFGASSPTRSGKCARIQAYRKLQF